MQLLAFAGKMISKVEEERYTGELDWFQHRGLEAFGVKLDTVYRRNVLWCEEVHGLMFVDFERAKEKKK